MRMLLNRARRRRAPTIESNRALHAVIAHIDDSGAISLHHSVMSGVRGVRIVAEPAPVHIARRVGVDRAIIGEDIVAQRGDIDAISSFVVLDYLARGKVVCLLVVGGVDAIVQTLLPIDDAHVRLGGIPLCLQVDVLVDSRAESELLAGRLVEPAGEGVAAARRLRGLGGGLAAAVAVGRDDGGAVARVVSDPLHGLDNRSEVNLRGGELDLTGDAVLFTSLVRVAYDGLIGTNGESDVLIGEHLPEQAFLGDLHHPCLVAEVNAGGLTETGVDLDGLTGVNSALRSKLERHNCFSFGIERPAEEHLIRIGASGSGRLKNGVALRYNLSVDLLLAVVELVGHESAVGRACHHVDGEVLNVEGLDVGLGLAGVDLGHGRGVVGHMVDGHVLALQVRVEEADVHLAVGLDLLAVLDEGHVDGLVAVEGLALLGHGLFDGLAHGAVAHALGVNLSPCGDNAGFGGHLHGDVADVGVTLERLGGGGLLGFRLLRHGGCLRLGGGLGLVHLLRGLLRFRAVGLVLGLRLGLFDILQRGDDLSTVSLGGGVGARVVREHGHVQEREYQQHRQQD